MLYTNSSFHIMEFSVTKIADFRFFYIPCVDLMNIWFTAYNVGENDKNKKEMVH